MFVIWEGRKYFDVNMRLKEISIFPVGAMFYAICQAFSMLISNRLLCCNWGLKTYTPFQNIVFDRIKK